MEIRPRDNPVFIKTKISYNTFAINAIEKGRIKIQPIRLQYYLLSKNLPKVQKIFISALRLNL